MEILYKSLKIWSFFCFQDGILVLSRLKSAGAYMHTGWFSFPSELVTELVQNFHYVQFSCMMY